MFWILAVTSCVSWNAQTEEEALFLRRIADFWEEGEYAIAQHQMEAFLTSFPDSSFTDLLNAALGDLALRENSYSTALQHYAAIASSELVSTTFLNRMQCLYHLQWHATLADECEKKLQEETLDAQCKLQTTYFLAIALYQQSLSAAQQPELLMQLAKRAEPHFALLLDSDLSSEVAEGFAHLCCILKEFPRASEIYLKEGNLFQAALVQAEYDKELACQTFSQLAKQGGEKAMEAAYNRLLLEFELGKFQDLVAQKEHFLSTVPEEQIGMAHLFFGRSFLSLQRHSDALAELHLALSHSLPTDSMRAAFFFLFETATALCDIEQLDQALAQFDRHFPNDPERFKGLFARATLLKTLERREEAKQAFTELSACNTPFQAEVLLELAHFDYDAQSWLSAAERAELFLTHYPAHPLAPFAWRYLAYSKAAESPQAFSVVLEQLLAHQELFPPSERLDWEFLFAKAHFDQQLYGAAKEALRTLLASNEPFSQRANASLLLALSLRDSEDDLASFCSLAEQALEAGADLIDATSCHASLFNAYLEQGDAARAADHLFAAFETGATIASENLLWLVEFYFPQPEKSQQTMALLQSLLNQTAIHPLTKEALSCKLASLYEHLHQPEAQIALLESLFELYRSLPDVAWQSEHEAKLLLAEGHAARGESQLALELFEAIVAASPNLRSKVGAAASLQAIRLHKEQELSPERREALLVQLKNLMLQKVFQHEPIHLEAALEYATLQTALPPQAIWTKLKSDFERSDDLLSQDYQNARSHFPHIDQIYRQYLIYMEAEILLAQEKELQAKGKDLLLQIIDQNAHAPLTVQAKQRLDAIEQ